MYNQMPIWLPSIVMAIIVGAAIIGNAIERKDEDDDE